MSTFEYFSYGSNMLARRLRARCSSARAVAIAEAPGYSLRFNKRSADGSAKASFVEEPKARLLGVVYHICQSQRRNLDNAEGRGQGYECVEGFQVVCLQTQSIYHAMTYLATDIENSLQPYDWYLALVMAGCTENHFDKEYTNRVRQNRFVIDKEHDRKARLRAIEILAASGYPDYNELLF